MNDLEVPQALYDSEIAFSISVFWDNGFEVAIGIAPDFNEEANVRTFREACKWL